MTPSGMRIGSAGPASAARKMSVWTSAGVRLVATAPISGPAFLTMTSAKVLSPLISIITGGPSTSRDLNDPNNFIYYQGAIGNDEPHQFKLSGSYLLPGDVSASQRYWKEDIIEPEVIVSPQGTIRAPESSGLGFAPRLDRIESLTRRREAFG